MHNELEKFVYYDGDGVLRVGANDIIVNLELLNKNVINGFVIKWIDYWDIDVYETVLAYLLYTNKNRKWNDKLHLCPTNKGVLVITYKKWIIDGLWDEISNLIGNYRVYDVTENKICDIATFNCCNDETVTLEDEDWVLYFNCPELPSQILRYVKGDIADMVTLCNSSTSDNFRFGAKNLINGQTIGVEFNKKDLEYDDEFMLDMSKCELNEYKQKLQNNVEKMYNNNFEMVLMRLRSFCG